SGNYTLMDRRPLQQSTLSMTAVVDAFFVPGALQIAVCHICPCSPPQDQLLVAVPAFRDGVLSAAFGAFGVLGHPFISLRLCCGRCHMLLLIARLVVVLRFPAIDLCLFVLSGRNARFLAVFYPELFVLSLGLPCCLCIQRVQRQQDMGMGILFGR